ncbi:peptidase M15 [Candidatus Pacearchaeota archaeon]|nr:peptidase M15 [Candidatus Pacearchaeota archaeon]
MAIEVYNGYLTKNFAYQEMIKSSTAARLGISNDATREHVVNLVNLCNFILQPVREEFGPIRINSGYRSSALNKAVGGSKTSQHCNGEAADFESSRISNPELAAWVAKHLDFDQLILEFYDGKDPHSGWVHCSYKKDDTNRGNTLTALRVNGKTQYKKGLLS